MSKLVIIESPGKAGTIKGYLGSGYKVVASVGHVKDLPKSTLGVDIENGFKAKYVNIRDKNELINNLKKEVKQADEIFLATDPDREGEAIAWHLATALECDEAKTSRVTYNELTKEAVCRAIENPGKINMNLVDSQQARRILDRIVGYKLSPFLWKTVKSGLSAGRVQSVATKIIVDRENEIRAFVPKEYWTIESELETAKNEVFKARFFGINGAKTEVTSAEEALSVEEGSKKEDFVVSSVKKTLKYKNPQPPFITSTLQQEASKKLNFRSQRTMKVAQELYEGINLGADLGGTQGIITYMRTDSLRISDTALSALREHIDREYGKKYLPSKARIFKAKAGAQDAHEAIRPSSLEFPPKLIKDKLSADQYRLYKLIWDRFVASQMSPAELDTVSLDINAGMYTYRASGYTVKFKGYMAVYEETEDSVDEERGIKLPEVNEGDSMKLLDLVKKQHFTEPPARFTEASLIKQLEEMGIGRPSTFTPIITTIVARNYVKRSGKSLAPTSLGEVTTQLMTDFFSDIVDYKFTANMENSLDNISHGTESMQDVLGNFWRDFSVTLEKAEETVKGKKYKYADEQTDIICEKCGATMVIKSGRYGDFAACPNYPSCKNTKKIDKNGNVVPEKEKTPVVKTDMKCEKCGGMMVIRSGPYGEFYACENFPTCKNTLQKTEPTGAACPKCGGNVVKKKHGRREYFACANSPKCDFTTSHTPSNEKCPKCGSSMFTKKSGENICLNEKCR